MNIDLTTTTNGQQPDGISHKCQSSQDENWFIFTCPLCPDYERRINKRTGEMKSKGVNEIRHKGFAVVAGLDVPLNQN